MAKPDPERQKKDYPMKETYKGRKIVIKSPEESAKLVKRRVEEGKLMIVEIDEKPIEVLQEGPEEFYSVYLTYKTYSSPMDLAKDVIDHVPSFKPKNKS